METVTVHSLYESIRKCDNKHKTDKSNNHMVCLNWASPLHGLVYVLAYWHSEELGQLKQVC